jgi:hypothetical protein
MRVAAAVLVVAMLACNGSPTEPRPTTLTTGTWSSQNTCLIVDQSTCTLHAGCGHGEFPRPTTLASGTFEVEGTYRMEVGPVSVDPPPPAHFSGSVNGKILTLTVVPSKDQPTASYSLHLGNPVMCPPLCL